MKQPTAGTLATITCIECGRQARSGELWRLYYADIGEAVTYCPECAKREFGEVSGQPWRCALAESAV